MVWVLVFMMILVVVDLGGGWEIIGVVEIMGVFVGGGGVQIVWVIVIVLCGGYVLFIGMIREEVGLMVEDVGRMQDVLWMGVLVGMVWMIVEEVI